ncbi:hypothetical protein NZD88_21060 [Chryseobacterium antibioticum]|uniref:Uncharacterized protein n=1 Tax=Chryseobacterium pyrolae TaxID=2987481 RepID=A0ABT2IN86_9FLAO|nr:hypothetical protein [Chryseobacterium pyrolae]MCT2410054.1 hypothetical protein [Chryseobacterium pyrolae]
MARINTRPDIIYVKDMSEVDKDNFEMILNKFKMTNNGKAIKRLFSEYLKIEKTISDKNSEIMILNKQLIDAEKEKKKFFENKNKLINALSDVGKTLIEAKKDISKL